MKKNCLLVLAILITGFYSQSQTLQRVQYTPEGIINSMAYNENYGLFIGGSFENWGINSGSMGLFSENNDSPENDFPRFYDGGISGDIIADGNGGWYISKQFYSLVNENDSLNAPPSNILHVLGNNKFDYNFLSQTHNNGYTQLALKNNILYAVGSEIQISTGVFTSLLAFNATTGAFIPCPIIRGNTNSIVISGNTMYISGNITEVNGLSVNRKWIAIDILTGNIKNWNPFQNDTNYGWGGFKIYQANGKIIVPYQRMDINTTGIAVFDTLLALSPIWKFDDSDLIVTSLGVDATKIIYSKADYSLGSRDILINAINLSDGGIVPNWNPNNFRIRNLINNNANISKYKIFSNSLYLVGRFDNVLGIGRNNVASIDIDNGTVNTWNPNSANELAYIETSGSKILCGTSGNCFFKAIKRPQIGLLNPITNELINNSFSFIPNHPLNQYAVSKLATSGENLWVSLVGSAIPNGQNLNAFDIRTGVKLNNEVTLSSSINISTENKLVPKDSILYVSFYANSTFTFINGQLRKEIFAISTSGILQPFSLNVAEQSIKDFEIVGDLLYLCGNFTQINGINQKYLACVNRFTGQLIDWNPNPERPINNIEIFGNNIVFSENQAYVGGFINPNPSLYRTFLIDRLSGKFVNAIDKPNSSFGQKSGSIISKNKYLFLGIDENSPCNTAYGKSLSYYDTENKKYPKKCIIPNYNFNNTIDANMMLFAESKLIFTTDYIGNNGFYYQGRQRIMQTIFPQGFFDDKIDYFPKKGHNGGSSTVHFYNNRISYGTKVRLLKTGQIPIIVKDSLLSYPEQFTLKTVLNLKGKATGDWDIELSLPTGEKIIVPNGFKINPPSPPKLNARFILPPALRTGRPTKGSLVISNLGEVDAFQIPLWLFYSKDLNIKIQVENIDGTNRNIVDSLTKINIVDIGGSSFNGNGSWINFPNLGGGQSNSIPVTVTAGGNNTTELGVFAGSPMMGCYDGICPDDYNTAKLIPDALKCTKELFQDALEDYLGLVGGTLGEIAGIISDFSQGGEIEANDVLGALTGYLADKLGGRSTQNLAKAQDALDDLFDRVDEAQNPPSPCNPFMTPRNMDRLKIPILNSQDPNDKLGPVGVHSQRYIKGNEPMNYLIRFENYASATAAAQYVKIIDTLNVNKFDFSTFQFGYFNVADTNFYATPGRKNYMRDWDLRPAKNLILRMEAAFNDTTGILKATYTALDPATMEWTEDPFLGFLPPNVNAPEGEGVIFFTISPKPTLVHNEQISNKAYIYFDYNPVIPTPPWTNTLDKIIPSSQVQTLPSVSRDTTLALTWAGNDLGAGTRLYDVYVSVNSNPYKLIIANSTLTNIIFKGKPDSSYRFYSIAVDSVGNEESVPMTFDTQTTIRLSTLIQSVKTGSWSDATTWDCNCIPAILDNVIIKSGHKVTVSPAMGPVKCRNLTIESGAVFDGRGVFEADSRH